MNAALDWLKSSAPTPVVTTTKSKGKKTKKTATSTAATSVAARPGSKKESAIAMYEKIVVQGGKDNSALISALMKDLKMTKTGARTYAYTAKSEYEKAHPKP